MYSGEIKLKKVLEQIKIRELDGIIIFSDGTCSILRPSYLHYFSEFRPMGKRNAAVISKSGKTVLLVEPYWDRIRASKKTWIKDVRGAKDFVKELKEIINELGIKEKVGVIGSKEMNNSLYKEIKKDIQIIPTDEIIEEIAKEKTEQEIKIIRKTAEIADLGAEAFIRHTRVGIREYELVSEIEFEMRLNGADDIFILLSSGKHNSEMHEPTDRRLTKGDIIICEITPVCEGQFIQVCRTVVLGSPDPVLMEKYLLLVYALEESLKKVRSGEPASLIPITMNQIFSKEGYSKYCAPPYMRSRGHGFGVGSIAPGPEITENMETILEKHQVIAIHPNQYLPETGYLACGETIMVTDEGYERLTKTETKLYIKGV